MPTQSWFELIETNNPNLQATIMNFYYDVCCSNCKEILQVSSVGIVNILPEMCRCLYYRRREEKDVNGHGGKRGVVLFEHASTKDSIWLPFSRPFPDIEQDECLSGNHK